MCKIEKQKSGKDWSGSKKADSVVTYFCSRYYSSTDFFFECSRVRFAHFQCYCDHTSANKTAAIAAHEASIEALAAEIADRTAQSEQLSSEIATLQADMDANAKVRLAASQIHQNIPERSSNILNAT